MLTLSRWKVVLVLLSVVIGLLFSAPNVIPAAMRANLPGFMPKQTLNLGLDLQGGSHLLFEVDTVALRKELQTNVVEDTRTVLGDAKIASSQPAVVGNDVVVRITDPAQVQDAARAIRKTVGAPLQGAAGGRDVVVTNAADQKIRS